MSMYELDPQDVDFIKQCLGNKELLSLMFSSDITPVQTLIDIHKATYNQKTSNELFVNMIELSTRHEAHWSGEQASYSAVAKHLGADVHNRGAVKCDLLTSLGEPVEVKAGPFDRKALAQLQGYMSALGVNTGVAVGTSQKCDLPTGITFVCIKFNDLTFEWDIIAPSST